MLSLQHIVDLALLVAILLFMAVVLAGWGHLAARVIGLPNESAINTSAIWTGFAAVIMMVEFLHLMFTVDWRMTLALASIGILSAFFIEPIRWLNSIHGLQRYVRDYPWAAVAMTLLIFFWCSQAMKAPENYDSGLYHFESIRWLNEYPIVPGLGNLHGRLAFNQSYFGYIALVNTAPFFNKGYAVGGLFLLLLLLATIIETRLDRLKGGTWLTCFLLYIILPYGNDSSSPSPDFPVALLQIAIFLILLKIVLPGESKEQPSIRQGALLFLLCTTVFTIKLSAAMFAISSILVSIPFLYRGVIQDRRVAIKSLLICTSATIVHLLRGYIYSGVPLYPSTFAGAWSLDWALPIEAVKNEASWIYSLARRPGQSPADVLGNYDWLTPWLRNFPNKYWYMLASPAILIASRFILLRSRANSYKTSDKTIYSLFIPLLASIVFWFFTAPDLRFLGAILKLQAILSVWLLIRSFQKTEPHRGTATFTPRKLLQIFFVTVIALYIKKSDLPSHTGWTEINSIATEVKTTTSGLQVVVPSKGDQCWNEPLPCTPYFNVELKNRAGAVGTDFHSGFSVKTGR